MQSKLVVRENGGKYEVVNVARFGDGNVSRVVICVKDNYDEALRIVKNGRIEKWQER